ncbi:hypothetical protein MKX64_03860 [Paenibacillus sp. FSL M8-0334]|uniref:SMI1/KNR4 family protein n=1 Tax=Paenibacillus campinasensis TaxID=66347 RepID=A0ABW9T760_9BACL|nr:hypothetical protein [Paenibacillus campinasensis]MUG67970.1 hypothetical protein [Paenibacillus campinasensis]
MNVKDFIRQFNARYPDVDRCARNNSREITELEGRLGVPLPQSFRMFLSELSNGMFLLDSEPVGGCSSESPCGEICMTKVILPDLPEQVAVAGLTEKVEASRLVSFTMFDAAALSNDHWVFIYEEGIPNDEYRLGFISQRSKSIVTTLPSFEEWLTILWQHDDEEGAGVPVFHALYPNVEERDRLLEQDGGT